MTDLLLKNVRVSPGDTVDVLVRAGRIARIGAAIDGAADALVEDGGGALLLPGLFASPATVPQAEEAGHGAQEPEGHLELSPEQIQAAGIELAAAGPRRLNRVLSLPGEIRFDEDRTSHIVPRAAGVVESVQVNLGQAVKRGELLAVIASQQLSLIHI